MSEQNQSWVAFSVVGMGLFVVGFLMEWGSWVPEYGLMGGGLVMTFTAVLKAAAGTTQQNDSLI